MSEDGKVWLVAVAVLLLLMGSYARGVEADREAGRLVPYEGSEHIPMGQ